MLTPLFSIVIPVKNEAENVRPLIEEIRGACRTVGDYEIIVVDDGSTDKTLETLRSMKLDAAFHTEATPLVIVKNPHNLGQSTSLLLGVREARANWIVTLDGDRQNDPADIPSLLQRAKANPEIALIAGQRLKRRDSLNKRLASRAANFIRSKALQDGTPDTGCGLKLIRRDVFLALPYFDHMHRYLPALTRRHHGIVELVPVNHRHRTEGTSKYGTLDRLWVGIWDLMGVMWLLRRNHLPAAKPTVE